MLDQMQDEPKKVIKKKGRPPIDPSKKKKIRGIKLTDEVWKFLDGLGNGKRSNAIDTLIKHYNESAHV